MGTSPDAAPFFLHSDTLHVTRWAIQKWRPAVIFVPDSPHHRVRLVSLNFIFFLDFTNLISLGLPSYISNKYYDAILDGVPMVRGFFVVTISENIMVLCSQSITLLLLFSVIVTLNTIKQSFSWFNKLNYIFYKDNVLWQTWTFDIHIRYIYILSNTSTVEWKSLD